MHFPNMVPDRSEGKGQSSVQDAVSCSRWLSPQDRGSPGRGCRGDPVLLRRLDRHEASTGDTFSIMIARGKLTETQISEKTSHVHGLET